MDFLIKAGDFACVKWNGSLYGKEIHGHVVEVTDKMIRLVELHGQITFSIQRDEIKEYTVKNLYRTG